MFVLLLLASAYAHVPELLGAGRDHVVPDFSAKSLGLYFRLGQNSTRFHLTCKPGETLSLSLSKPVGVAGTATAALSGLGTCSPGFTGWGDRRLLELPKVEPQKEFEPFGVGGYVPLVACETECDGAVVLTVAGRNELPVVLGAGTIEKFSVGDLAFMSFTLYGVFRWTGQDSGWFWLTGTFTVVVSGAYTLLRNLGSLTRLWRLNVLCAAVALRVSAAIFVAQIVFLATHLVPMGIKLVIPLVAHIAIPLCQAFFLECCVQRRDRPWRTVLWALAIYNAFFCWQGYGIPSLALVFAAMPAIGYTPLVEPL